MGSKRSGTEDQKLLDAIRQVHNENVLKPGHVVTSNVRGFGEKKIKSVNGPMIETDDGKVYHRNMVRVISEGFDKKKLDKQSNSKSDKSEKSDKSKKNPFAKNGDDSSPSKDNKKFDSKKKSKKSSPLDSQDAITISGDKDKVEINPQDMQTTIRIKEESSVLMQRMRLLARSGLIDKDSQTKFQVVLRKMVDEKNLTPEERTFVQKVFEKLAGYITTDNTVFQRIKKMASETPVNEAWGVRNGPEDKMPQGDYKECSDCKGKGCRVCKGIGCIPCSPKKINKPIKPRIKSNKPFNFSEKNESLNEEKYKVGDLVKPHLGPHKNQVHRVIHVHDDGRVNIRPERLRAKQIKYRLGVVSAHPHQIARHKEVKERALTPGEMKTRESNVKSIKQKASGDLKKRYGKDWKSVAYAIATKQAKNEEKSVNEEKQHSWDSYGKAVKSLVDKYSKHNVNDSSSRSAPNTSKFTASHSGKISYHQHQAVHKHYIGSPAAPTTDFHHVVRIGSNYPSEKRKEFLDKYKKIKPPSNVDNNRVHHDSVVGSNYSVHGVRKSPQRTNEENKENKPQYKTVERKVLRKGLITGKPYYVTKKVRVKVRKSRGWVLPVDEEHEPNTKVKITYGVHKGKYTHVTDKSPSNQFCHTPLGIYHHSDLKPVRKYNRSTRKPQTNEK